MRCRALDSRVLLLLALAALAWSLPTTAVAQLGAAGVVIDAQGVLHTRFYPDPGGRLMQQRVAAARASMDPNLTAFSARRMISLNRLEEVIRKRGGVVTDEMRYLAGLQRVEYVFYYPDTGDVVIAGPAEGWVADPAGRVVGRWRHQVVVGRFRCHRGGR